jgi:hypothetical protein
MKTTRILFRLLALLFVTGQAVFVEKLPPGIYTSHDLRESENVYFVHFGGTHDPVFHFIDNRWSRDVRLFILHTPPQDYN